MLHVAKKAFWPARPAVPGHAHRHRPQLPRGHRLPGLDRRARSTCGSSSRRCRSRSTRAGSSRTPGRAPRATGSRRPRCSTRSSQHDFDAVMGGARRDEEKARAKERFFSFRDEFGQWDPKNQRPEVWNIYNGRHRKGEHIRVFPLSNWTELDIWQYIDERTDRAAVDLLRASPPGVPPRRHADGGHRLPPAGRQRGGVRGRRSGTAPSATRRARPRSSRAPTRSTQIIAEVAALAHHRTRRDARRRQVLRSGHGRPQA